MGPRFCPPRKTSLQATRGNVDEPLLAPTSVHTQIQTLIKRLLQAPFFLLTWLHQAFFPFPTFSTRTCLRDSVPEMGGYVGTSSLLIQTNQSHHAQIATLSPDLSFNYPLNTWCPKTNPKCSSTCMLSSFLQRFALSSGFPFSAPCSTIDLPHTLPRPIPFFYAL